MLHQQNASRLDCFSCDAAPSMKPVNRSRAVVNGPGRSGRAPPWRRWRGRPAWTAAPVGLLAMPPAMTPPCPLRLIPWPVPAGVFTCHAAYSDTVRLRDDSACSQETLSETCMRCMEVFADTRHPIQATAEWSGVYYARCAFGWPPQCMPVQVWLT